jgi:ATP-binding cassette subfamily E protein 1
LLRVATLDKEHCKPDDCGIPCYRFCPEVLNRRYAIRFVAGQKKPIIDEDLCTGCGICIKKCPFDAISIVKLPQELDGECIHSYGVNEFKLFRLPIPRSGTVTGLIGRNGTGKSSALRILAGELTPNFGALETSSSWENVLSRYRGTLLYEYFEKLAAKKMKVVHKPQHVDKIGSVLEGEVKQILRKVDERGKLAALTGELELDPLMDRDIKVLSGGELQRVAIAAAISRDVDVYIFDEPSSHLDVYQRVRAARSIRGLVDEGKSVLVAEHDLAMLDYLSDEVYLVYGQASVYGIISHVHPTRGGINDYLIGFLADENMRFRDEPIRFHVRPPREVDVETQVKLEWLRITKAIGNFSLEVESGDMNAGEIVGIVGPNGIGKTTFIKELLEYYSKSSQNQLQVSYKPQYISSDYDGTVDQLLTSTADDYSSSMFTEQILRPLSINKLLERRITELSGGELQRVAIATCLGKSAQLYLLDEPSAFLDIEERLTVARALRHLIDSRQAFAFVVEHDIVAQDFLADRIMVFKGLPSRDGHGSSPLPLRDAMNLFLFDMGVTFRRDPETKRPRINKLDSKLDKEQKSSGQFYYVTVNE